MKRQISNGAKKIAYTLGAFLLSFPVIAVADGGSGLEKGFDSMHRGVGMMGCGGFWPFLMTAGFVIWLVVGVLVIIWLWGKITNDKK